VGCTLGGTEYTPPKVQKWKELRWVLLLVGGSSRRSVGGFRNESVVFNEGAGDLQLPASRFRA